MFRWQTQFLNIYKVLRECSFITGGWIGRKVERTTKIISGKERGVRKNHKKGVLRKLTPCRRGVNKKNMCNILRDLEYHVKLYQHVVGTSCCQSTRGHMLWVLTTVMSVLWKSCRLTWGCCCRCSTTCCKNVVSSTWDYLNTSSCTHWQSSCLFLFTPCTLLESLSSVVYVTTIQSLWGIQSTVHVWHIIRQKQWENTMCHTWSTGKI